jgi:hypothetical protein
MIRYFISAGDESVSDMFSPYVWNNLGFSTLFSNKFSNKSYGSDLKLILIKYYVEGKFEVNGPEKPKVSNYSKKNKDISVAYTVHTNDFHLRDDIERKEFIVESTLNAIILVQEKLFKQRLDIDFEGLLTDIKLIAIGFLDSTKSTG